MKTARILDVSYGIFGLEYDNTKGTKNTMRLDAITYEKAAEPALLVLPELPAASVSLHARFAAIGRERIEPGDVAAFQLDFQLDAPFPDLKETLVTFATCRVPELGTVFEHH